MGKKGWFCLFKKLIEVLKQLLFLEIDTTQYNSIGKTSTQRRLGMKDLFKLIDACCEAYDNEGWKPIQDNPSTPENERRTFCNFAVNYVATKMGYVGFKGLLANQIVELMETSNSTSLPRWTRIKASEAQELANLGFLVIAGVKETPHGHVAVVRPGNSTQSGKWKTSAPKLMNVGAKNSIAVGANFVFKEIPQFFRLDL